MATSFTARDANGEPITGLAESATWLVFKEAVTGDDVDGPTIRELGTTGQYAYDAPVDGTGVLSLGLSAFPSLVAHLLAGSLVTFAAYGVIDGVVVLLSDVVPTWLSFVDVEDGSDVDPPTIEAVGGGLFRFVPVDSSAHLRGVIYLGETAFPRTLDYDSELGLGGGVQISPDIEIELQSDGEIEIEVDC